MATARLTIGTLLDTVSTAAVTTTSAIGIFAKGVESLDIFATKTLTEQRIRADVDLEKFTERLIQETAEEEATANNRVVEFCAKSANHKKYYEAAYDRYSKLVKRPDPAAQTA